MDYGFQEDEEIGREMWQEACWTVISTFFEEKGLVRQQLESYDEFIRQSVQKVLEENSAIDLVPEAQHYTTQDEEPVGIVLNTCLASEKRVCFNSRPWSPQKVNWVT